jgi:hypothetical protein
MNDRDTEFERIKQAHQNVIQNEGGRPTRKWFYAVTILVAVGLVLLGLLLVDQRKLVVTLGDDISNRSDQRDADLNELKRVGNSIDETLNLIKQALCPGQASDERCEPSDSDARTAETIGRIVDSNGNGTPDTTEILQQQEQIQRDLDRILGR